jgi:hypothetical protein
LQIGLGEFVRAALIDHLVDHGNGKIGAQADRRDHEIGLVLAVLASDALHFGLEGDEHVTNAVLDERSGRRTAASVEHRHIGEQLAHELLRLLLIAFVRLERVGVGRKISVTAVARSLGIGEHDLHVIADEIAPVLDHA